MAVWRLFLLTTLAAVAASSAQQQHLLLHHHREKWLKAGSLFESLAFPMRSSVIRLIEQISQESEAIGVSKTCRASLDKFAQDLRASRADAMHMLDSFGKFTPGVLKKRRLTDFGHYDQCLSVRNARYLLLEYHWPAPASVDDLDVLFANDSDTGPRTWVKDYSSKWRTCTMYMVPPMIGICVPSHCTTRDLTAIVESSVITNKTEPFKVCSLLRKTHSIGRSPD